MPQRTKSAARKWTPKNNAENLCYAAEKLISDSGDKTARMPIRPT